MFIVQNEQNDRLYVEQIDNEVKKKKDYENNQIEDRAIAYNWELKLIQKIGYHGDASKTYEAKNI